MAITFEDEEQHFPAGTILGVFVLLVVFGGGGFFGVRYLMYRQQTIVPAASADIQLNKQILSDPRLDSLELLPDITADNETVGRDNPFESLSTSDQTKTNNTKAGVSAGTQAKNGAGIGVPPGVGQSPVTSGMLQQEITKTQGAQE